jgi:hypothetical protein
VHSKDGPPEPRETVPLCHCDAVPSVRTIGSTRRDGPPSIGVRD